MNGERDPKHSRRVWWQAFAGKGGAKRWLDIREREHLLVEADPVEKSAAQCAPERRQLGVTCLRTVLRDAEEYTTTDLPLERGDQENVILQER